MPTSVELFSGAGGLALGLEQAGFSHILLSEIDKTACSTLQSNRPNWNVIQGDVSLIDFSSYKADLVAGGFPCQSFSTAGKHLGFEDARGTLFFEFARAVKEIQPTVCLGENVKGLLQHDKGNTIQGMVSVLEQLGYNIQYKLLNAVNYGVPQKRERVFIVGVRNNITFNFPTSSLKLFTVKHALDGVPSSPGKTYTENKKQVMDLVPPGGNWRSLPVEVQKSYMKKSYYNGGGNTGIARRVSWDEACPTLTCDPAQKMTERCHPSETRPFTTREYARIQTFPDDWQFMGSMASQYHQIGNAVPVHLAKAIGQAIIESLQSTS